MELVYSSRGIRDIGSAEHKKNFDSFHYTMVWHNKINIICIIICIIVSNMVVLFVSFTIHQTSIIVIWAFILSDNKTAQNGMWHAMWNMYVMKEYITEKRLGKWWKKKYSMVKHRNKLDAVNEQWSMGRTYEVQYCHEFSVKGKDAMISVDLSVPLEYGSLYSFLFSQYSVRTQWMLLATQCYDILFSSSLQFELLSILIPFHFIRFDCKTT